MQLHARPFFFIALAVASSTAPRSGHAAEPPVNIIFDTDMGADCDDVGALFVLHGAVERGEARLLATMGCVSADAIAPALDGINTWFGRPEIPVGTLKDPGLLVGPHYTTELAKRFPHRFRSGKDYPDAVTLYRQILAKEPDGSVVIVAVGPLRNIANLLKSRPDRACTLDGSALVAKKVKRLEVMGGNYPPSASKKDAEWNFKQDPASAALVGSDWPTPILFNGEGGSTCSGRRVTYEMPEHNPLTIAYKAGASAGFAGDRLSWDPVSCLVAVRGPAPWYRVEKGGTNAVDPKTGINTWKPDAEGKHSYLVLDQKRPKRDVETALEDLMVAGKGRPAHLTFNTAYYATAGMCQISSKGAADVNATAIKAFDLDDKTAWQDKGASSWIQCQYVDGRKYLVTSYAFLCPDPRRQPRRVELAGSNDGGANWTPLDLQETPGFTGQVLRREFTLAKPAKWNIYRLGVTAADEKEGVQIAEVELNEAIQSHAGTRPTALTLDGTSITVAAHGRQTLNATVSPSNTFERAVAWTSSDPSVAEVRRIGEQVAVVVGKTPGKCTITACAGKVTQTCIVTVTQSTLPVGWQYDELNAPTIPGLVDTRDGTFTLTGCGHAMSSFWERVRDQGVFVSERAPGDFETSARLVSLSRNAGGPKAYHADNRPPTASGLMLRESLDEKASRFFLVQVEATGDLVCRWRDKGGDQDGGRAKSLGKVAVPSHLRLVRTGKLVEAFVSADGKDWGKPVMSHTLTMDAGRCGMFVCSGNTFSSATAVYDSVKSPVAPK